MVQTAVNADFDQAYEGKVHVSGAYPTTYISRLAAATVYFGKAVVANSQTNLVLGEQEVKLPAAAGDVPLLLGVSAADVTKSPSSTGYAAYDADESVTVMRKGLIWVVSADAITNLGTNGVWVRHANGAAVQTASLGSFRATTNADYTEWSATQDVKWIAYKLIGSVHYGLLEINLP